MRKPLNITIDADLIKSAKKKYKNISRAIESLIVKDLDVRQYTPKDVISHPHISGGYEVCDAELVFLYQHKFIKEDMIFDIHDVEDMQLRISDYLEIHINKIGDLIRVTNGAVIFGAKQ